MHFRDIFDNRRQYIVDLLFELCGGVVHISIRVDCMRLMHRRGVLDCWRKCLHELRRRDVRIGCSSNGMHGLCDRHLLSRIGSSFVEYMQVVQRRHC